MAVHRCTSREQCKLLLEMKWLNSSTSTLRITMQLWNKTKQKLKDWETFYGQTNEQGVECYRLYTRITEENCACVCLCICVAEIMQSLFISGLRWTAQVLEAKQASLLNILWSNLHFELYEWTTCWKIRFSEQKEGWGFNNVVCVIKICVSFSVCQIYEYLKFLFIYITNKTNLNGWKY